MNEIEQRFSKQENICAGVPFKKNEPATLLKRDSGTGVFL